MTAARLVLHNNNDRRTLGTRADELYTTIMIVLVESCTIYAAGYILFVGPWAAGSPVS